MRVPQGCKRTSNEMPGASNPSKDLQDRCDVVEERCKGSQLVRTLCDERFNKLRLEQFVGESVPQTLTPCEIYKSRGVVDMADRRLAC